MHVFENDISKEISKKKRKKNHHYSRAMIHAGVRSFNL